MADITVTFADGQPHTYSGVPDDVTPDQIEQRATKDFAGRKVLHLARENATAQKSPDIQKPESLVEQIPGQLPAKEPAPEPSLYDKAVGGAEAAFGTLGGIAAGAVAAPYGVAKDIYERTLGGGKSGVSEADKYAGEVMDNAPLQPKTELGKEYLGKIGEVASTLPAFIPEVAGASEAGSLAKAGAQMGGAKGGQMAGKIADVVGKITSPIYTINEEKAVLAKKAMDKDITIPLHALTDNKYLKLVGEFLDNLPLSGSSLEKNKTSFHKGIIQQIGGDASKDVLTPSVFGNAVDKVGGKIGDIYRKTIVPMDASFAKDIKSVLADQDVMVGENLEQMYKYVAKIGALSSKYSGKIPGEDLRHLNTQLNETLRGLKPGDLKNALTDLKESIGDAVVRSLPDDATRAELKDLNMKYAKAMTILPLVSKGGLSGFTPSALKSALINNASGKRRMATDSAGELGDFANLAQEFMKEQKSSMTTERHLATGAIVGGLVGVGRAATGLVVGNIYNRLSPKLSQAIVNKTLKPVQMEKAAAAKRASDLADAQAKANAAEAERLAPRVLKPGEEGAYPVKKAATEPPKTRGLLSIDEENKTALSGKSKHLTSDIEHIEFPLRQEVLQWPEHAEAINSYVRRAKAWQDKISNASDYDKIAEYQTQLDKISKSFGEHMAKFGIDSAEDATGLRRPLYDGGKGKTKMPIIKVQDYSTRAADLAKRHRNNEAIKRSEQ